MSKKDSVSLRFGPLFAFRWLLLDPRKAGCMRPDPAFGLAERFSARLGRPHRCAKLGQKTGYRSAHLLRHYQTLLCFVGTIEGLPQIMSQPELITSTGHAPVPALHLLKQYARSPHPRARLA